MSGLATSAMPAPVQPAARQGVDLGALFDAHGPELLRYCERMTGRRELAEEIVQDVFIVAHRRRRDLMVGTNLRAWLYQVANHRMQHHRRATARWMRMIERFMGLGSVAGEASGPEAAATASSEARRVMRAVSALPRHQREVFVLYELQEIEGAEVAAILGVSVNTVWSRLRLGRERFRLAWQAEEAR